MKCKVKTTQCTRHLTYNPAVQRQDIKPNLTRNSSLIMLILSSSGKTDWRNTDQTSFFTYCMNIQQW